MLIDPNLLRTLQLQTLLARQENMAQFSNSKYITTSDQWEELRSLITKLYMDDEWELKDIRQEIQRQYGLKATKKMYKQRLKKWKLWRYYKRHEVETILKIEHQRSRLGKQSKFILRDKVVNWDDIEQYAKRNRISNPIFESTEIISDTPDLVVFTPPSTPLISTPPSGEEEPSPSPPVSVVRISLPDGFSSPQFASNAWTSSTTSHISSPSQLILSDLTWSAASHTSSPLSVPRSVTLPALFGNRENFMHSITVGFELLMPGPWTLSNQLEMPWNPVQVNAVNAISKPVISPWYYLDECARHLDNGLVQSQKGDVIMARKDWSAAMSLVPQVVQSTHYNVVSKLVDCVSHLYRKGHEGLAHMFRRHVRGMAKKHLGAGHPYYHIFCALEQLPFEDLEELQIQVLDCLVKGLENFLGPDAFTSFEYKMLLALRRIEASPYQEIDKVMPTDIQCDHSLGCTSSKTFLALNLRIGAFKSRGLLADAQQVCLQIINRAMFVEDPAMRLWHLSSAYVSLGSVQFDQGLYQPMEFSLQNAMKVEGELRSKYGMVKLGEGELNWIAEKLNRPPIFTEVDDFFD